MNIVIGAFLLTCSGAPFYLVCGSTIRGQTVNRGVSVTLLVVHLVGFWIGMGLLLDDVGTSFVGALLLAPAAWGFLKATSPRRPARPDDGDR